MLSSTFTGPFEDGYRKFPVEPQTSTFLILIPILIAVIDIIYCYIMHQTALRMPVTTMNASSPKPNGYKITIYQKWYQRLYAYLLNADYSEYYCSASTVDEEEILNHWINRISLFGTKQNFTLRNSKCLWLNMFLKLWSFGCGSLGFVLVFVLFCNVTGQFIVVVLKYKTYYNFILFFFMNSVHLFLLKRFINSIYLLCNNITDAYNMRIASIWRFTTGALVLLGALGINSQQNIDNGIYASDMDIQRWMAVLMVYRGMVWFGVILLCSVANALYMTHKTYICKIDFSLKVKQVKDKLQKLKKHSKLNIDSETLIALEKSKSVFARKNAQKYKLKLWMLLFNLHPADSKRGRTLKIVYVCMIWMFILIYTIVLLAIGTKDESASYYVAFRLLLIMYYIINIFNRGMYHSLFYFWSGQYHIGFWSILKRYAYDGVGIDPVSPDFELGSLENIRSLSADASIPPQDTTLSNDAKEEHVLEQTVDDITAQQEEQKSDKTDNIQVQIRDEVAENDSDVIVYPNVINPQFPIETKPILFDDFWCSIMPHKEDYFSCRSNALLCVRIMILLFAFFMFMLIIFVFLSEQKAPNISNTRLMSLDKSTEIFTEYPFCEENFNEYLNILDMSYLINTAYQVKFGYSEIAMRVEKYFKNATDHGWTLKYLQKSNPGFYHLRNTKYNFDIIAIRGTQSFEDMLQDMDLFMAQFVLQWTSKILPITSVFPYSFIRTYINTAGILTQHLFSGNDGGLRFDYPIYNYIRWNLWKNITKGMNEEVDNAPDYTLYIVGHSLGGAIADIVASHLSYEGYYHIKTVTLGSPGLLWASQFFKMDVVSYTTVSYALLNSYDPVCNVDEHVGTQTWVHCDAPQMSSYCHKVSPYISSVISNCGEDFETNINETMLECIKEEIYSEWKTCCFPDNWECGGSVPLHNASTDIPIEITPNYPRSVK